MPPYFFSTFYIFQHSPIINAKANFFPRMMMQVMEPLMLLITLLDTVCWIAGGAFIFGAIGRYIQYWYNPSQSPISQALFLGALGIILMLLPIIGQYALPHH